jgi:hypothetical protein
LPQVRHVWPEHVGEDAFERGPGIGLALVREIVALQGGRVEAFSEGVGKGARQLLAAAARRLGGAGLMVLYHLHVGEFYKLSDRQAAPLPKRLISHAFAMLAQNLLNCTHHNKEST